MPRRSDSWRKLVPGLICVAALFVAALSVLLFARVGALHGDTVTLYAATAEARGVAKGTQVWLNGVKVGVVEGVHFRSVAADTSHRLLLELSVLEEHRPLIRRDARAQIRSGGTLLGAPVVFVSGGSASAAPVGEGDTLRSLPQQDPEGLTSNFAHASAEFPAIIGNVKVLTAQLRGASGTAGAILNADANEGQLSILRDRATDVVRRAKMPRGTVGLALGGGDLLGRVQQATAQVDSIRTLLTSDATSFGRFRRDSTLLRTANDLRNELAITSALLERPGGTAGRVLRDSAIVRQVAGARVQLDSLITDIKNRPLRYWPF
jgi:phospholipid/cholesterol/gamma-HCH transport system substrate-binding protein